MTLYPWNKTGLFRKRRKVKILINYKQDRRNKKNLSERTGKQNDLQSRAKRQTHKNKKTRKLESQSRRSNICKTEVSEKKLF